MTMPLSPHLQLKDRAAVGVAPIAQGSRDEFGLIHEHASADEVVIARFGKRQQLRRNFHLFSVVSLTVTLMGTWEGLLSNLVAGLANGGPSGLVYGTLVSWIGVFSQVLVMSEMASMIPLSGGQYNWVALLAPRWCSKFLSYITGWSTLLGWQAITVLGFYITGAYIQGILIQVYPDTYSPEPYQSVLISYGSVFFALVSNTILSKYLPNIEGFILLFHVFGFLAVVITVTYFGPHAPSSQVWANFQNEGGWQTEGLSFFIGLTTSMTAFLGIDGACHMAEEVGDAPRILPRSMIASVALNGLIGFAALVAVLYCMGNVDNALNTPTGFPIIEIFYQAVGNNSGTAGLMSIFVIGSVFASVGSLAGTSRMMWAFAREKGIPGYSMLARIDPRTHIPLYTIALVTLISMLLALITLGSTVVLQSLLSLSTGAFYTSYITPAACLLHRRLTDPQSIEWGPFKLGAFGIPINVFMLAYSAQGVFFSFWPVMRESTLETFNWSIVVYGGVMVLAMAFWAIYGRKVYKGPIVEVHIS